MPEASAAYSAFVAEDLSGIDLEDFISDHSKSSIVVIRSNLIQMSDWETPWYFYALRSLVD